MMEKLINIEIFKILRKKSGLSQKELSEKCNPSVSVRTISEIETHSEDKKKVNKNIFKGLRVGLGVTEETLTGKNQNFDKVVDLEENLTIDKLTSDNMSSVSKRYNVTKDDIINLAPLLFAKFAEQCLEEEFQKLIESGYVKDNYIKQDFGYLKRWLGTNKDLDKNGDDEELEPDHCIEIENKIYSLLRNKDICFTELKNPKHDDHYRIRDTYSSFHEFYNPMDNFIIETCNNAHLRDKVKHSIDTYRESGPHFYNRNNGKIEHGNILRYRFLDVKQDYYNDAEL